MAGPRWGLLRVHPAATVPDMGTNDYDEVHDTDVTRLATIVLLLVVMFIGVATIPNGALAVIWCWLISGLAFVTFVRCVPKPDEGYRDEAGNWVSRD